MPREIGGHGVMDESDSSVKGPLPLPTTSRGLKTRALLVEKAREIFERKGYLDTVVADIAAASGVAHGTFYKYFTSKQDIFRVLALELQAAMIGDPPDDSRAGDGDRERTGPAARSIEDWWARVEDNNRRYLTSYMENAKLMAMVEQVATFNDEMLQLRREIRQVFVRRSDRAVARLQSEGLAYADVDARYAATALGSMVDRFAYVWLVLGEDFELEESARTLTLLWARAIGLPEPDSA